MLEQFWSHLLRLLNRCDFKLKLGAFVSEQVLFCDWFSLSKRKCHSLLHNTCELIRFLFIFKFCVSFILVKVRLHLIIEIIQANLNKKKVVYVTCKVCNILVCIEIKIHCLPLISNGCRQILRPEFYCFIASRIKVWLSELAHLLVKKIIIIFFSGFILYLRRGKVFSW